MGPIFLSWRYRRWCFCVEVDGQEEEYVHNNDESFKKEAFHMHDKDEKRMVTIRKYNWFFFLPIFQRNTHLLLKNDKYGLKHLGIKRWCLDFVLVVFNVDINCNFSSIKFPCFKNVIFHKSKRTGGPFEWLCAGWATRKLDKICFSLYHLHPIYSSEFCIIFPHSIYFFCIL